MSANLANSSRCDYLADLTRVAVLSRQRPVWLRVGQLIDGSSDKPLCDANLVFDARQIRFVGSENVLPPDGMLASPGQSRPDAVFADVTALPCLIEAHAHMFLDGAPVDLEQREAYLKQPAEWMLSRGRARWPKVLQSGVGAIRDAGDKHGVGLALAAEAKKRRGEIGSLPWIDSPGAAIHHRGRYGSFMGEPIEDHAGPAECVAARVVAGADRIKLLVSGIINFKAGRVTVPPQMPVEEVAALVAAAGKHGRQTFAHASGADGVENSIEGGVTTVEHGFFVTEEQLAKMRDRRIAWVPTFAPVQAQIDWADELGWNAEIVGHLKRIIEGHQTMLAQAHTMGVPIVAGSDAGSCGVPHGVGFLTELCQMERGGMPSMAVIRSATGISAATLDFPEPIGRIVPGCRTRLIFTPHDPLATVANMQKDKVIVFDGQVIASDGNLATDGL